MTTLSICADNSDFSSRVAAVVSALRSERKGRYMQLYFIREGQLLVLTLKVMPRVHIYLFMCVGDGYAEAYFARFLVEDR